MKKRCEFAKESLGVVVDKYVLPVGCDCRVGCGETTFQGDSKINARKLTGKAHFEEHAFLQWFESTAAIQDSTINNPIRQQRSLSFVG